MTETLKLIDIDLPQPRGAAPIRRPNSVRRTSSIDVSWPDGPQKNMQFHGVGRDVYTPASGGSPEVIRKDEMFAEITPERTIVSISAQPPRPEIERLVGVRGGGYLRSALNETLPQERDAGSPLYLLVDDLSGASLVSGWALHSRGFSRIEDLSEEQREALMTQREGVCIGFRPGSSALNYSLETKRDLQNTAIVAPLHNPDDPDGWHDLKYSDDLSFRRARRIDVWFDGDLQIDATFQDTASKPSGEREAVHEYSLHVTADPETLIIKTIEATPHILPFPECPNAIESIHKMIGRSVGDMRAAVLEEFPRVKGCTHLNDCMRSISEAPMLVAELRKRG